MKNNSVAILIRWHSPIILFLNVGYRLALGRIVHSRTLILFHLRCTDKIHSCLNLLRTAAVVLTISGRFETVLHTQYVIVRLRENIDFGQASIVDVVLQFSLLVVR